MNESITTNLRNLLIARSAPDFSLSLLLKFIYSEKATKFCEISTLLLSTVHADKNKVKISENFVAFSEYMNFIIHPFLDVILTYYIPISQCTLVYLTCNPT